MRNKKVTSIIIAALVLLGLIFWGVHAFMNRPSGPAAGQAASTTISSFTVERPNLVVHSSNLARLEVYAVPTGTGVSEADIQKLGDASLENTSDNRMQTWVLPIPKNPILATDIYVIGYNQGNQAVASMSLGITGATAINDALWGSGTIATSTSGQNSSDPTANELKTLKIGQSASFNGLTVTLKSVDSDSRCAEGVQCIQAGNVTGTLTLTLNGTPATRAFDSSKSFVYQGYTISVDSIHPAPSQGQRDLTKYQITFRIQES
jgi:hypothetical protein